MKLDNMIDVNTLAAAKAYTDKHGGQGGTSNYNALDNRPSVNGNTLEGDMSTAQLGISLSKESNVVNSITAGAIPTLSKSQDGHSLIFSPGTAIAAEQVSVVTDASLSDSNSSEEGGNE